VLPIFDDEAQIKAVLGALIKRYIYIAISTEIDRSVNQLEIDGTVILLATVPGRQRETDAPQRANVGARLLEGHDARSGDLLEQACGGRPDPDSHSPVRKVLRF